MRLLLRASPLEGMEWGAGDRARGERRCVGVGVGLWFPSS